jgi:hypothetical protein
MMRFGNELFNYIKKTTTTTSTNMALKATMRSSDVW